jgi:lysophospholipase L1-like esterase
MMGRSTLPRLLAGALLGSAAANLLLLRQGWHYYRMWRQTQIDPLGLRNATPNPHAAPRPATGDTTVVFWGDSRAEQWVFPTGLSGFRCINRGIDGQTSAQALYRFAQDVLPLQPDIILIQVGINDLRLIPALPDDKAFIIATCKQHLRSMVAKAVAGGAQVILTTIFPVGRPALTQAQRLVWSPAIVHAVEDVNAMIRTLTAPNLTIFDSYATLEDAGLVRKTFAADWLHLNAAGYAALNAALEPLLTKVREDA